MTILDDPISYDAMRADKGAWRVFVRSFLCLLMCLSVCMSCMMSCRRGDGEDAHGITIRGEALGTFYTVTFVPTPGAADADADAIPDLIEETLDSINTLMSTYRQDSELSRLNRHHDGTPFPLSPATYAVFEMAQKISGQSDGAFDITVGPLVNAWGFGPDAFVAPPAEETVNTLLERVGYRKLTLHPDGTVSKAHPDVYCDLSAIAKGYAVDAIAAALEETGILRYMVEVGGEIRVAGLNPKGEPWRLGIEKPAPGERQLHTVVHLESGALATSGNYRNMYEVDGQVFTHTIDPKTGYPVRHHLLSASVIHPSCAMADGYATALMALGHEKALKLARKHDLAVMLIVAGENSATLDVFSTPAFDTYLDGE